MEITDTDINALYQRFSMQLNQYLILIMSYFWKVARALTYVLPDYVSRKTHLLSLNLTI